MLEKNRLFWDAKAKENPYWYVSSFGDYNSRSTEEFWASGPRIWHDLKEATGYNPHPSHVVAEIGCGVGRLTRAIAPEVSRVHAYDLSPEMIRIAQTHPFPNVTFYPSDGESLSPLPGHSTDFVLAYCVFQHLPSLEVLAGYLVEMARVAKRRSRGAFTLTPRDWRVHLLPVSRLRRRLIDAVHHGGPSGLHKKEWVGIRPSIREVNELSSLRFSQVMLHGDKWLFHTITD